MDADTLRLLVILVVVVCGVPGTIFVLGPIGRAIAERIAGRPLPGDSDVDEEALEGVRGRLAASERQLADVTQRLEATQQRLMDVEERLDFAERLLMRHTESKQLGEGD